MPKYQVTVTYSITVDDAKDKNHAEFCALYDIGSDPLDYTHIEIKEIHKPKCCGLRAQTCVIDDVILPEFDENDPDIECVYNVWKNIVEDYTKEKK